MCVCVGGLPPFISNIVKQHAFVCIWVDALMGMWIHTDIWV